MYYQRLGPELPGGSWNLGGRAVRGAPWPGSSGKSPQQGLLDKS